MQKWMYALMANVGTYVWAPSVDRGWPQHHFMPRSASFLSFFVPILQSLDSLSLPLAYVGVMEAVGAGNGKNQADNNGKCSSGINGCIVCILHADVKKRRREEGRGERNGGGSREEEAKKAREIGKIWEIAVESTITSGQGGKQIIFPPILIHMKQEINQLTSS